MQEITEYLTFILSCIYFMIPAYAANMAPVFVRGLKFLNRPVDFGLKLWDNQRVFGKNKTWRGLFFGVFAGLLIFLLQKQLYTAGVLRNISVIDYTAASFLIGIGLGLGALLGDLAGSFIKRRLKIKEGQDIPVLDQSDFAVGAVLFSFWLLSWPQLITILLVSPSLHWLANYIGYKFRIRID